MRGDPVRHPQTRTAHPRPLSVLLAGIMLILAACTSAGDATTTTAEPDGCADVVEATVERSGDSFVVTATVRSADTGWDRYADEWHVRTPDGDVLGTRVLTHPHVDEQPFTRSLTNVEIPASTSSVEIAARDSVVGYCGITATVPVP